jgi:hypothetical protein
VSRDEVERISSLIEWENAKRGEFTTLYDLAVTLLRQGYSESGGRAGPLSRESVIQTLLIPKDRLNIALETIADSKIKYVELRLDDIDYRDDKLGYDPKFYLCSADLEEQPHYLEYLLRPKHNNRWVLRGEELFARDANFLKDNVEKSLQEIADEISKGNVKLSYDNKDTLSVEGTNLSYVSYFIPESEHRIAELQERAEKLKKTGNQKAYESVMRGIEQHKLNPSDECHWAFKIVRT